MSREDFRSELFTEPTEYEETPLRDRKRQLLNLYRDDDKAEFLRDVIALANTARRWGKPAYLIFGLDNEGALQDIGTSLKPYQEKVSAQDYLRAGEEIRRQIGALIREYISPPLYGWEFKIGQVRSYWVAYLLIEPECPEEAFHVARDLKSGQKYLLESGECWIRSGESKAKCERTALSISAPGYRQVPFIAPSGWLRYFESLLADEGVQRAAQKRPYLELHTRDGRPVDDVIQQFLESEQTLLIIEGTPGCGKTTLLYRLVKECAEAGQVAMEETRRKEEFRQPQGWIPVYFSLRDARFENVSDLAKQILREVNIKGKFWKEEPSVPERLLESDLRWLICLDGMDELWEERAIQNFIAILREFRKRYPGVKMLVTTRPVITIPGDIQSIQIAPLTTHDIRAYLQNLVDENNEFYRQLDGGLSDPASELYCLGEICTTPLYLESLASLITPEVSSVELLPEPAPSAGSPVGGEPPAKTLSRPRAIPVEMVITEGGTEEVEEATEETSPGQEPAEATNPPLTIGQVIARIVQGVWEREKSRRAINPTYPHRWWIATGQLGLEMDGHHDFVTHQKAQKSYSSKDGLQFVLNLGILRSSERGIGFSHPLLQHYFAAEHLKNHNRIPEWESRCKPDFWQKVQTILGQISY